MTNKAKSGASKKTAVKENEDLNSILVIKTVVSLKKKVNLNGSTKIIMRILTAVVS